VLGLGVGLSLLYVGYPGDLPFMVYCVHNGGVIPAKHFLPMLLCASISITGGGSLGPEAPIVLMCGW
jgi:H+/Cl- antiporter ClcA